MSAKKPTLATMLIAQPADSRPGASRKRGRGRPPLGKKAMGDRLTLRLGTALGRAIERQRQPGESLAQTARRVLESGLEGGTS